MVQALYLKIILKIDISPRIYYDLVGYGLIRNNNYSFNQQSLNKFCIYQNIELNVFELRNSSQRFTS